MEDLDGDRDRGSAPRRARVTPPADSKPGLRHCEPYAHGLKSPASASASVLSRTAGAGAATIVAVTTLACVSAPETGRGSRTKGGELVVCRCDISRSPGTAETVPP